MNTRYSESERYVRYIHLFKTLRLYLVASVSILVAYHLSPGGKWQMASGSVMPNDPGSNPLGAHPLIFHKMDA